MFVHFIKFIYQQQAAAGPNIGPNIGPFYNI
jgi:hypothetical protein